MHSAVPALPFFCLDFARSPTDAKPPDAWRCPWCVALRARCACQLVGHPRVGVLHAWVRCHARLHGSQPPLAPVVWLRPVVLRNMVNAAIIVVLLFLCSSSDLRQSFLAQPLACYRPIRPQLFYFVFCAGFCPINHHLID